VLRWHQCDVTVFDEQRAAFRAAANFSPNGTLNHVFAFAGIDDHRHLVDQVVEESAMSFEAATAPSMSQIGVNLQGCIITSYLTLFTAKLQAKAATTNGSERDMSLTVISSLAGYVETGLHPFFSVAPTPLKCIALFAHFTSLHEMSSGDCTSRTLL